MTGHGAVNVIVLHVLCNNDIIRRIIIYMKLIQIDDDIILWKIATTSTSTNILRIYFRTPNIFIKWKYCLLNCYYLFIIYYHVDRIMNCQAPTLCIYVIKLLSYTHSNPSANLFNQYSLYSFMYTMILIIVSIHAYLAAIYV